VVIIGDPGFAGESLRNAVTRGVLSTQLDIAGVTYDQLGAAINPGNSGGPVLDMTGRVVGAATLTARLQQGIGFSIPREAILDAIHQVESSTPNILFAAAVKHAASMTRDQFESLVRDAPMPRKLAILDPTCGRIDGARRLGG
jgi:serine protease Do